MPVVCCDTAAQPVLITFLGVSGWHILRGGSVVLTAPLFSNPGLGDVAVAGVRADTARVDSALVTLDVRLADVDVVLSGHGHYDHLLDVPYVMRAHARAATLLLNRTGAHQIASAGLGARAIVVDDSASTPDSVGAWNRVGAVRVMALRSDHGPQFAGVSLFHGERDRDLPALPVAAHEWLDGRSHAYLIDFMEGDRVAFRVYYQDAVAAEPAGFVPEALLWPQDSTARPVDLALLVPSSYPETSFHPEALIDHLRPRHVLLGHWESFFRSTVEDPEPLLINDFRHFTARLENALTAIGEPADAWHMPVAGARFELR